MDSAEPMNLGSPIGSSVTTPPSHQPGHGHQFLPGFLMGNLAQGSPPQSLNQSLSGQKHQQATSPIFGTKSTGRSFGQRHEDRFKMLSNGGESHLKEKGGAPPLASLSDEMAMLERQAGHKSNITYGSSIKIFSPPKNISPTRTGLDRTHSGLMTASSLDGMSPDGFQTPTAITSAWVTVFGFPPQQMSLILKQFSQFGTILSYHVAADNGNWVHIQYETLLQAKKALSRNGKVLGDNMMLGVMPCKGPPNNEDKHILEDSMLSITSPSIPNRRPIQIRNLSASVHSPSPQVGNSTPQKSSTVITKAMDFFFG